MNFFFSSGNIKSKDVAEKNENSVIARSNWNGSVNMFRVSRGQNDVREFSCAFQRLRPCLLRSDVNLFFFVFFPSKVTGSEERNCWSASSRNVRKKGEELNGRICLRASYESFDAV